MTGKPWPRGAAISTLIPHQGRMCLLDAVLDCSAERITCTATSHTAADHPLRGANGLPAPVGIEYAAQAMALHGALNAKPGVGLIIFKQSDANVIETVARIRELVPALQAAVPPAI